MSMKNVTKVLIDGKIYTLGGYEDESYLLKVAYYLNNKIAELSEMPGYSRTSVDVRNMLLSLNIADDYFKAKSQVERLEEDVEQKDKESYDVKHDLIAAQIQLEKLKGEVEKEQLEKEKLQQEIVRLNTELDDLLK